MSDLLLFPQRLELTNAGELADAAERDAALDIQQSWIVEAPAGSGKTGLLIQRYLKLLADASVTEPEQVLAITFTTKATAEMRERVLTQLQMAADGKKPAKDFDRATRPFAMDVIHRDRELGWNLLNQPRRLNIRTIDSVCSEIANSLPILSGSGGRRTPVDDAAPLYALAARRTFLELGGTRDEQARELHDALRDILLHRDGNLAECEKLLGEMLALRDQWGKLVPLGRGELDDAWLDANILPKLERTLDQAICAALTQLAETIPAEVLVQLTIAAADMAALDGYKGKTSPIVVCAGRRDAPGATSDDLDHWRALAHLLITPSSQTWRKVFHKHIVGFETGKFEQEQLKQIVRALEDDDQLLCALCKLGSVPPAKYPTHQWGMAKSLFRVLNRALAELQIVFAEYGECDFAELALAARTALTSSDGTHDLEAALGVRLQHILVDEMQDTSSSQYELIQALTRSWDGHSQTAFLVGDPKQSIYLFRQARVERFLRTMRSGLIGDLPVGDLRLTANFRSQPALVDDFNADFVSIFPAAFDTLHPEEVPYVHAYAARAHSTILGAPFIAASRDEWEGAGDTLNCGLALAANAPAPPRVWHSITLPYETESIQKAKNTRAQRRSDALEIVRIVNDWRSRPLPLGRTDAWKIAVLCRSRNHLDEIVAAFKTAEIPFRAVDIDPLKDRPEVQDLIALTRALLHPADRVAWLAILRAPWCGLSLADLHTLTGSDDSAFSQVTIQSLIDSRGDLLTEDAIQRLERIWPALAAAVEARARLSVSQLVERTWRSLGGDCYLDAAEFANATRYLQLLNQIEDGIEEAPGAFDLSLLERRLDKLYAAPALAAGAVDVLTIHKAKGLEWDVVIVPALERRAPSSRGRLLNWIEIDSPDEQSAHMLLAPIAGKGEPSQELTNWIRSIHNAREAAERKRLFYVACTRAREELHLFAAPTLSAKDEIKPAPSSLLAAAWPAAAAHFECIEEDAQPLALAAVSDPSQDAAQTLIAPFIAASRDGWDGNTIPATAPLKRLPLAFNPAVRLRNEHPLSYGNYPETPTATHFERPEGSLAARAFGNAVHAFLEQITLRFAAGEAPATLLAGLPNWQPRIAAALRSEGLQPAVVERLTQRVVFALESTLKDRTGLWLLSPHPRAATEYALTAWAAQRSNIRIDRMFDAGSGPLQPGTDHLWIVDYKTTTHGSEGMDTFLAAEKAKYAPQLEAYAAVMSQTADAPAIRVALYYPLLAKIIWWPWPE